ncbi:hypothetical protein [Azospirillum sp. B510]|uniref:hypothetical protein n=1 Tax=Azospirillum sp. (strain B510) TaxID=137722 RepID=UPI0005A793BD|nr:hypothetical protein [Azospirillum sp. B510]
MTPQAIVDTTPRLFHVMTQVDSRKAGQAVDDFVAHLSMPGLPDDARAEAYEAALKHLMGYLIQNEGWLAEEFTATARSLGAY